MPFDPFDPFATQTDDELSHGSALADEAEAAGLGPQYRGRKVVRWPGDKLPPKRNDPGYAGPNAVFIDEVTGELVGVSPQPTATAPNPLGYKRHTERTLEEGPFPPLADQPADPFAIG